MNCEVLPALIHPFFSQFSTHYRFKQRPLTGLASSVNLSLKWTHPNELRRKQLPNFPEISSINMDGYLLRLQRFLKIFSHSFLLVAEEHEFVSATLLLLKQIGHDPTKVLLYQTLHGDPRPASKNWQEVMEIIRFQQTVKKILVAGQSSCIPSKTSLGELTGCVPGFVRQMRPELSEYHIEIITSPVVYPLWKRNSTSALNQAIKPKDQLSTEYR